MAAAAAIPAPEIDWDSPNLSEALRKFQQHVELIFAGPLTELKEPEKIAYLLIWIGGKGRDIYNTWELSDEQKKTLKTSTQNLVSMQASSKHCLRSI